MWIAMNVEMNSTGQLRPVTLDVRLIWFLHQSHLSQGGRTAVCQNLTKRKNLERIRKDELWEIEKIGENWEKSGKVRKNWGKLGKMGYI